MDCTCVCYVFHEKIKSNGWSHGWEHGKSMAYTFCITSWRWINKVLWLTSGWWHSHWLLSVLHCCYFHTTQGNIKIMSVNPSHYRITVVFWHYHIFQDQAIVSICLKTTSIISVDIISVDLLKWLLSSQCFDFRVYDFKEGLRRQGCNPQLDCYCRCD